MQSSLVDPFAELVDKFPTVENLADGCLDSQLSRKLF